MKAVALAIACAAAACGPPAARVSAPPVVVAPPPPPAYEAARSPNLGAIAADATHVYWVDGGLHRRGHGGATPAERLFAGDGWIDQIAVGASDVFFIEDGYRLRAIPKAGGAPSELAGLDDLALDLVADGDGVWVLTGTRLERWSREPDERTVELPGAAAAFAIAGGDAYVSVRDADATLYRIDLATGEATALSDAWYLADARELGVSGGSLVAAVRDGVVTVPLRGGPPTYTMPMMVYGIAIDGAGYAVSTDTALVAHDRGAPPRLLAAMSSTTTVGGAPAVALGGGYAYHTTYATDGADVILRGEPRGSGAEMLRVPDGAEVSAIAADRDRVFVAIDRHGRGEVVELARTGVTTRATVDGFVDGLVAGGGQLAFSTGSLLHGVADGRAAVISEELAAPPVALHRGRVYWSDGLDLRAVPVAGGAPVVVIAGSGDGAAGVRDSHLTLRFADEHLYLVRQGDEPSLVRVDERRRIETVWTHPGDDGYLDASLAVIGDAAYLHDGRRLFRVPLDGGAASVLLEDPEYAFMQIWAVDGHLVVWKRPGTGDELLLDVPLDGGAPETIFTGGLYGNPVMMMAAGDRAMFVHDAALGAILRVPVE